MWKRQVVDEVKYIIELDGVGPVDNRPSMNKDGSPKKLCLERRKNGLFSRMNKKIWEKTKYPSESLDNFASCDTFFFFNYTLFYHFFIDRNLTWWAALITDPPPSSSTNWSIFFACETWHVTHDTWHIMWHVTHDKQGVVNIVPKFQIPSSNSLWVLMSCDT